jgi:hypothetical protein
VIKLASIKSEYQKQYRLANIDHLLQVEANYRKLSTKRTSAYRGIIDCCSKCGKRGYKFYSININQKTGVTSFYATVHHYAFNNSEKWAYNHCCFIGSGKVWG